MRRRPAGACALAAAAVTAGEARYISKMHPAAFGQSTGLIHVNYSAHTDVTVAAFKVAP